MIALLLRWKRLFIVPIPLLGTLVHTAACRFQCGKVLLIGAFVLAGLLVFPASMQAQQQDTLDRARQQRVEQLRQRREAEMHEHMKERQKEIQARIQRNTAPPAKAVNEQDSLALVALYNSTDGENWDNNDGWLEESVSDWYGVTVSGDRVTSVDLSSNQLTGEIPPELSELSNLLYLDLRSNQLTGEVPPELSDLSNLLSLELHSNQLTGEIPPDLSDLSALQSLNLNSNQLAGEIPSELSNLSALGSLDLGSNQLTGEIPPDLSDLSALQSLSLSSNQLTGEIPPELSDLSNLIYLNLSSNQLTQEIPSELSNLSNLIYLYLSSNQLSGAIPPSFINLTALSNSEYGTFHFDGTNLCEPPDSDFQAWISSISSVQSTEMVCSEGVYTSEVPLASSFRMPIGEVKGGEDLGNNLTLLERGYWPESGYPNLRFNDDGDQDEDDTNEWYVATAHNKDESSISAFDGETDPYLESGAHHPGEDWNLTSGGSSDEGEPVLAAADGIVLHDGCVKNANQGLSASRSIAAASRPKA